MTDTTQLPDEKTIMLRAPIDFDGQTFKSITLREPTVGQIEDAKRWAGETSAIRLIALCSGTPEGAVRLMKARDYKQASDFVQSFFA